MPEGQVYMPRLESTAPIHLADRNPAHYPPRHCTNFKKRWLNDGLPEHMFPSIREYYYYYYYLNKRLGDKKNTTAKNKDKGDTHFVLNQFSCPSRQRTYMTI